MGYGGPGFESHLLPQPLFATSHDAAFNFFRVPYRIGIFRSVSVSIFWYLQIPYRRQNRSVFRIVRNYDKVRNMIKLKIKGTL